MGTALVTNARLTSIELGYNRIGDKGAERIVAAVATNTTLKSIELACNEISGQFVERIAVSMAKNRAGFRVFSVSGQQQASGQYILVCSSLGGEEIILELAPTEGLAALSAVVASKSGHA